MIGANLGSEGDRIRLWLLLGALNGALAVAVAALGALNGALAVAFAALGAHAPGAHAPGAHTLVESQGWITTAYQFQLWHALALLAIGCLGRTGLGGLLLNATGCLFLAGIVCFSGGLYLQALTHVTALGFLVPLGGSAFILGWLCLAVFAVQNPALRPRAHPGKEQS